MKRRARTFPYPEQEEKCIEDSILCLADRSALRVTEKHQYSCDRSHNYGDTSPHDRTTFVEKESLIRGDWVDTAYATPKIMWLIKHILPPSRGLYSEYVFCQIVLYYCVIIRGSVGSHITSDNATRQSLLPAHIWSQTQKNGFFSAFFTCVWHWVSIKTQASIPIWV